MGLVSEGKADVGVVQLIGRADGDVIHLVPLAAQLVNVPVKAFKLHKEVSSGKIAVNNPNRIVGVKGRHQAITSFPDIVFQIMILRRLEGGDHTGVYLRPITHSKSLSGKL